MKESKVLSRIAIIAVCLLVGGLILGSIGWGIGYSDYKAGRAKDTMSFDESISETIQKLDIKLNVGKLNIRTGDSVRIVAENFRKDTLSWSVENGTLRIKEDGFEFKWNLNWFGFHGFNYAPVLTVYLPEDHLLDSADIKVGVGSSDIDRLQTKDLKLEAGVGEINGNNIMADRSRLDCGVGQIRLRNVHFNGLNVDGGVGAINLEGIMTGELDIEGGLGEIRMDIKGEKADYWIDVSRGLGDVVVDGVHSGKHNYNNNAKNRIHASNGIGSIVINFI